MCRPAHILADAPAEPKTACDEVAERAGRTRGGAYSAAGAVVDLAAARDGDELGDGLGVLALVHLGGHVAVAGGAALLDRVEHERLGPRRRVEVRPDLRRSRSPP